MNIAVIGIGNVGGTLGRRWAKNGHTIVFGVRNPHTEKVKTVLAAAGENAKAVDVREAAAAAEVVVLTTPWDATQSVVEMLSSHLTGKILVDCTNPINSQLTGLSIGLTTSAAERVAAWAPRAKVVKAFNTTGSKNMANPRYGHEAVTMFIAGGDPEAKRVVAELAEELGFDVVDTGALSTSRYLEPLAMLWVHMAYVNNVGPDFAFRIIKR
jgi:NADPH-dependent F420 reductase